ESGSKKRREKFSNLPVGGFLNTRVYTDKDYKPDKNIVDLNVTVQPGQFTLVEAIGYKIPQSKLKKLVPVYEEGTVDSDLVEEGRRRVLSFMQQEGYFDAKVESEVINATLDNAVQINYHIDKGEQHHVAGVRIEGNSYFTEEEIKEVMKIHGPRLFDHATFSPELLEADRKKILSMYVNAGFLDAKVDGQFVEKDHSLTITISIVEG